jgi:ketosteroid isomerase-like protein
MSLKRLFPIAISACLAILTFHVMAADLRAAMEADNARWLAAFNTPNPAAFPAMYTKDALLLPQGAQPVTGGPEAIKRFWESNIKAGVKDGKYAYQAAKWTVVLVKSTGEKIPLSGNTIRIFERQSDGTWLTKIHMFNGHQ